MTAYRNGLKAPKPGLSYDEAMARCKAGAKVREASMSPGWSIFYIPTGRAKGFYCLNPHTGSNYAFSTAQHAEYLTSKKWSVL